MRGFLNGLHTLAGLVALALAIGTAYPASFSGAEENTRGEEPALSVGFLGSASSEHVTLRMAVSGIDLVDPSLVGEDAEHGQGHLHVLVDDGPIIETLDTLLVLFNMTPKNHTITVTLAKNDHSPVGAMQAVTVNSADGRWDETDRTGTGEESPGEVPLPENDALLLPHAAITAQLVDIEENAERHAVTMLVETSGIGLVQPGSFPRPGKGHLQYQLDGGPVIATTRKSMSFGDLSSGEHTITVIVASSNRSQGPFVTFRFIIP